MGSGRGTRRGPLQAATRILVAAVLALGLVPLPAFAVAPDGGATAAAGVETTAQQGAGAPDGGPKLLATAPLAAAPDSARLGAQDEGNLYAVFDSEYGSLTFKREAGTYADGEEVGTKTYYTGIEDTPYSFDMQPSWSSKASEIRKVDFQTPVAPKSCAYWFCNCWNLEEVLNAGQLDASGVESMQCMFSNCRKLTSLDVSKWNTSKVADMGSMFVGCSNLANLDVSGWVTSKVANMSYMFNGCASLASLDVSEWNTSGVTDMGSMFYGCSELASLDVSKWNTSKVADMGGMFSGCSELATLDVSGWDTSKVTDMAGMFGSCSSLASLDVSGWDTSKVTGMGSMFNFCSSLTSLDVSGWNTSKVESMAYMFNNCSKLVSLDVSGWDTGSVEIMKGMFYNCSELDFLDLSRWDTSNAENMQDMFEGCTSLSSVRLGGKFSFRGAPGIPSEYYAVLPDAPASLGCDGKWINESATGAEGVKAGDLRDGYPNDTNPSLAPGTYAWEGTTKVAVYDSYDDSLTFKREAGRYNNGETDGTKTYYTGFESAEYSSAYEVPWFDKRYGIEKVDFQATVAPKTCARWFSGCQSLVEVQGAGRLTTSGVSNMKYMFANCRMLPSLDVSGWNTSKVREMTSLFDCCLKLSYLDVSRWDTSRTETMARAFAGCSSLASLDVSGWNTSKVENMEGMFSGCSSLASLDVSGWSTSKVADMGSMFSVCRNLAFLDVSGWVTSRVNRMPGMFSGCFSLASLDVSGWDTSDVTDMTSMFSGCSELASLDASGWDTSDVTDMTSMFNGCSELAFLDVSGWDTSDVTNMGSMFNGCSKLSSVKLGGKFFFKGDASDPEWYAVLPDAPVDETHTGRWINESEEDSSGVTAADLRDNYPDTSDPSFAPGIYAWEIIPKVAVLDSADGSLTFKYEEGRYADGQVIGTRTYYIGFEDIEYSPGARPSWLAHAGDIRKVDFQTAVAPMSCAYWFAGCAKLAEVLGADKLDASDAASMCCMFSGCSSLAALDASKWETSKVADMEGLFEGCSSLSSLDLSGWDTSGAESMYCMFDGCTGLSSVTLGGKFSFKARSGARYDAVLPDAPSGAGRTGRWVNSSAPGAQGVTAAELRDGYPNAADPKFAPGAYVWEAAIDLSAAKVTAPDQTYAGKALTPAPTVVLGGKMLAAGADYAVSYSDNVNAGTAVVVVTGKGAYSGTAKGKFAINKVSLAKAKVTLAKTSYAYDGKAKEPAVKSVVLDGKKLKAGTDYTVSYSNNRKPGKATATVTGKGNYAGTARAAFTVKLAKPRLSTAASASGRRVVASWKAVAGAKSYRLQYRKVGGKWRTLGAKVTSAAVGGLKAGGLYQFRVRAVAGKQAGAWSAASKRYLRPAKGVRASSKKAGAVTVRWKADRKASAGYEVSVGYSKGGGAAVTRIVAAGRTSVTLKGLKPGERAWAKVRPLRSSGGAAYEGVPTRAERPVKVAGKPKA